MKLNFSFIIQIINLTDVDYYIIYFREIKIFEFENDEVN